MPAKKKANVKANLDTKIGKYYLARRAGKNKTEAQLSAGFPDGAHATRIEATKTYQAIAAHYKDELTGQITLAEIAAEHKKNILQDQDRGAKNKAIEMALARIEPDATPSNEEDRMIVILRQ